MNSRENILRLCNEVCDRINGSPCLIAEGIQFYKLDFDRLCAAIIGLSRIALRPTLSCITEDHISLWKWCKFLLIDYQTPYFTQNQFEMRELAQTLFSSALANETLVPTEIWGEHAKIYFNNNHIVTSYLSFPFLEAILKRNCSNYLDLDGTVRQQFMKKSGKPYKVGSTCSSLFDLLTLHYTNIADRELKLDIDIMKYNFLEINNVCSMFDAIYKWRNSSLHGANTLFGIGGFVFNYALLVALFDIKDDYDFRKQAAQNNGS